MELKEVNPSMITIDQMNERKGSADEDFVENVKATGIIQPPLVRELNGEGMDAAMGAEYSVVVGGRRVDAAAQAGLESIHVFVVDWDDGEALLASITENIDAFREEVDVFSRAEAVQRLKDLRDWSNHDAADALGVSEMSIRRWLEPVNDEWQGTSFHPTIESNENDGTVGEARTIKQPSTETMATVRRMTGGGEAGEEVMERVQERELSDKDVLEARARLDRGQAETPIEAVEQVAKEKQEQIESRTNGQIIVHTRTTFTGDYASAIKRAAEDRSASDDQIVRTAVSQWLEQEGYL